MSQLTDQPNDNSAALLVESDIRRSEPLRNCVRHAIDNYFNHMQGHDISNLYAMVLNEIEKPLLQSVLDNTQDNQSVAARLLGISRSTLRKKMSEHELL